MIVVQTPPIGEPMDGAIWKKWFWFLALAINALTATGTTAERPNPAPFVGFMYFDTTLNRPIWAKTLTQYVYSDGTNA